MGSRGRAPRRLDAAATRAFLASKPGWAILTTIGADGYPHSVALGYFLVEDDIVLGTMANTRKLRNIAGNPKVCVLVETSHESVLTAVMVQGDAEVVSDDAARLALAREAARQRGVEEAQLPQQPRPGSAYVRVRPRRTITWHYA
ncbi:MAG: pyridoxamine 5'-phosphate oxidase family protein [Proteobacteria bacterium]|nr:pyridoxamine 5'-phosphate oxidase family protein [Pseudomonadota bacterium]